MPIFRFGDVFNKNFYTAYNVNSIQMGFAVNQFASMGTSLKRAPDTSSNLGLILGLVGGFLLLILIAVGGYWYKKKHSAKNEGLNASLTADVYASPQMPEATQTTAN